MGSPTSIARREIVGPALCLAFAIVVAVALLRVTFCGEQSLVLHGGSLLLRWVRAAVALTAVAVAVYRALHHPAAVRWLTALAVVAVVISLFVAWRARWLIGAWWLLAIASAVALTAVATSFAPRLLRTVTVLFVLGLTLLLTVIGRHETRQDQLADARVTATSIDGDLARAAAVVSTPKAARDALRDASSALKDAIEAPGVGSAAGSDVGSSLAVIVAAASAVATAENIDPSTVDNATKALEQLTIAVENATPATRTARIVAAAKKTVDAVGAVPAAIATVALEVTAQNEVSVLCRTADGTLIPSDPPATASDSAQPESCRRPTPKPTEESSKPTASSSTDECRINETAPAGGGTRALALLQACAKEAVAAVVATSGAKADVNALTDAKAALANVQTSAQRPAPMTDVVDFTSTGADRVLGALPGLRDRELPTLVTAIGWTVIAILALAGFQVLQRRSARRSPGSVTVNDLVGDTNDTGKPLGALLKFHVLHNVPEPLSVPGAVDASALTSVLETAAGPAGNLVGAIVTLMQKTVAPPSGYIVDATYLKPGATTAADNAVAIASPPVGAAATGLASARVAAPARTGTAESGDHRVVLRIQAADTKVFVAGTIVSGDTAELAARSAGYWAAGWIISRTVSVASWLRWSERTAPALAVYLDTATTATIEQSANAARLAPDSGLVLTLLGYQYDNAGRHRNALGSHLRAATLYPRYPIARYRAAVSMSLVAANLDVEWWTATLNERRVLIAAMKRLVEATGGAGAATAAQYAGLLFPNGFDAEETFCMMSAGQLDATAELLHPITVLDNAFDRQERSYWLRLRRHGFSEARTLRLLARTAALVSKARGGLPWGDADDTELEKLEREANTPGTSWQIAYNLACFYAVRNAPDSSDQDSALEWLQRMMTHPGTEHASAAWLSQDPDLKSVADDPRFELVKSVLPPDPEE